jgi:1,4-alpha-glucan branching enzyme
MKKLISSNKGPSRKEAFAFTAPGASSVQLAGEFTHWDQKPVNLQKGADGIWRIILELATTHNPRYMCRIPTAARTPSGRSLD